MQSLSRGIRRPGWRIRAPILLILIAAAIHFLLTGYHFAAWDQVLYLPLVHGYVDASTFSPHDAYMQGFLWKSYTTLFLALTPLVKSLGWEWPLFLTYAAVKFFMFLGFWALAFRLTRDHRAAALAVLLLVVNTLISTLSAQVPSSTLICRFVVMPFVLFGMERFLARRFRASAVLFGLGFQVHALTTCIWLVLTLFVVLFDARRLLFVQDANGMRRPRPAVGREVLQAVLIFVALALPIILWHAFTPTPFPKDYTVAEWMEISRQKHWYIFISRWSTGKWQDLAFSIALVAVVLPRLVRDGTWRPFAALILGSIVVLGIHYTISEVVLFRPLYQLQWIRVIDVPALAGVIAVSRALARAGRGRHGWMAALPGAVVFLVMTMGSRDLLVRALTLAACAGLVWGGRRVWVPAMLAAIAAAVLVLRPYAYSGLPPVSFGVLGAWRPNLLFFTLCLAAFGVYFCASLFLRPRRFLRATAVAGLLVMLVFVSAPSYRMRQPQWRGWSHVERRWARLALPGRELRSAWFGLQVWIRTNTPKGTLFFTPPGLIGFRVLSERSPFIEYCDGEVSIFDPGLGREWKRRMQLIGYWPPAIGGSAAGPALRAYHAITPERWIELAREEHVDYLVTSRPVELPFPKLHTAKEFTVWKIPMARTEEVIGTD